MKYLKYFKTDVDYKNYFNSNDFVTPNVSYVEDTNIVHYNPYDLIIMTSESNPEVMKVCYNQGWAKSPDEMHASEAAKVTSIGTAFKDLGVGSSSGDSGSNISFTFSFDEFKYFTGVTSIDNNAFYSSNIVSITIPNSVTSIGYNAFETCKSLTSITIPNSITSIGFAAFEGCTSLTSITIPDSVTSIDSNAFGNCSKLKEITCLATTAPSIMEYTFFNIRTYGFLKIPAGSNYSSWMSSRSHYLGYYHWRSQQ